MTATLMWTLSHDHSMTEEEDAIVLRGPGREIPLRQATPGIRTALASLASAVKSEDDLASTVLAQDGDARLPMLFYYLSRLSGIGALARTVSADGVRLATVRPLSRAYKFRSVPVNETASYVLSRFALLRRDGADMLLETPLGHGALVLHTWHGAALAAALAQPVTVAELSTRLPGVPAEAIETLLELALGLDIVAQADDSGAAPAESAGPLQQWEFHDLLFHARSRMGRQSAQVGGTFRFKESVSPLPALKPAMSSEFVELYTPDIEALKENDVSFTAVMEGRRSIRTPVERPPTGRQLGEFLYRSARVTRQMQSDSGEYAFRLYPGGGGEYELELYLAIYNCDGVPPGLYHYAPAEHRLYKVADLSEQVYTLMGFAAGAAVREVLPDILIMVAARFQRVQWKYESIAYAIILKDVGVLLQTMYLVATAMELSPCAIGSGDSDLFSTLTGLDYYAESSVGEFILGGTASADVDARGAELADTASWG